MILTLGIVVCVGVIGFSGYKLISTGLAYKEGEDEYSSLRKYTMEVAEAEVPQEDKSEAEDSSEQAQEDTRTPVEGVKQEQEQEPVVPPLQVDFASLEAINPDIVGWIYIEALDISYPVVHGEDNDFYLHRTFEKKDNFAGSIFVEYRNSGDFSDPNTIVYGHNMKNQSMFGKLKLLNAICVVYLTVIRTACTSGFLLRSTITATKFSACSTQMPQAMCIRCFRSREHCSWIILKPCSPSRKFR